jgi:hypothetical protein
VLAAGMIAISGPGSSQEKAPAITGFLGYFNLTLVVLPPLVDRWNLYPVWRRSGEARPTTT